MLLHDAVGITCKNGVTTENQGSGVKYMGLGVYVDDCLCHLDYLSLVEGGNHGILLLLLLCHEN